MSRRYEPNIIITGTPGCGKSSHSQSLVDQLNHDLKDLTTQFKHFNISELAKERDLIESYDKKLDTSIIDEDKLLDSLEEDLCKGGIIIDWHCCDLFPERLIDLVIVLRCNNSKLYDRLTKRKYKDNKIQENLDCEIMDVIINEARSSYIQDIVIELKSDEVEEMEENVDRINSWVKNWLKDHPKGVSNELPEINSNGDVINHEDDDVDDEYDDDDEVDQDQNQPYGEFNEGDDPNEDFVSHNESEYPDENYDEKDNIEDSAVNVKKDPAEVEEGLSNEQKYELEQGQQDENEEYLDDEEETNNAMEHDEDIAQ
ncbi:FAP7 [Candida pseudojiufengensis]|uniref:FAP7 n=1 Tax=Candida pseudojiufengensis TaxID=497109 RepID=UPI0022246A4D|nr:FAP7 [Candida pseudojiufengensis]KAI5966142.1 FAP7 [Candida pseudojiufengensis]